MILYQEEDDVMAYLNEIQKELNSNVLIFQDKQVDLEVSIGVAHFNHEMASSPDFDIEKAFIAADEALYIAKTQGKNQIFSKQKAKTSFA